MISRNLVNKWQTGDNMIVMSDSHRYQQGCYRRDWTAEIFAGSSDNPRDGVFQVGDCGQNNIWVDVNQGTSGIMFFKNYTRPCIAKISQDGDFVKIRFDVCGKEAMEEPLAFVNLANSPLLLATGKRMKKIQNNTWLLVRYDTIFTSAEEVHNKVSVNEKLQRYRLWKSVLINEPMVSYVERPLTGTPMSYHWIVHGINAKFTHGSGIAKTLKDLRFPLPMRKDFPTAKIGDYFVTHDEGRNTKILSIVIKDQPSDDSPAEIYGRETADNIVRTVRNLFVADEVVVLLAPFGTGLGRQSNEAFVKWFDQEFVGSYMGGKHMRWKIVIPVGHPDVQQHNFLVKDWMKLIIPWNMDFLTHVYYCKDSNYRGFEVAKPQTLLKFQEDVDLRPSYHELGECEKVPKAFSRDVVKSDLDLPGVPTDKVKRALIDIWSQHYNGISENDYLVVSTALESLESECISDFRSADDEWPKALLNHQICRLKDVVGVNIMKIGSRVIGRIGQK
jgi:hypothetical protein